MPHHLRWQRAAASKFVDAINHSRHIREFRSHRGVAELRKRRASRLERGRRPALTMQLVNSARQAARTMSGSPRLSPLAIVASCLHGFRGENSPSPPCCLILISGTASPQLPNFGSRSPARPGPNPNFGWSLHLPATLNPQADRGAAETRQPAGSIGFRASRLEHLAPARRSPRCGKACGCPT